MGDQFTMVDPLSFCCQVMIGPSSLQIYHKQMRKCDMQLVTFVVWEGQAFWAWPGWLDILGVPLMQCWSCWGANEWCYIEWWLHPRMASGHTDRRMAALLLTVLSQTNDKCSAPSNSEAVIWFSIMAIICYYRTQSVGEHLWGPYPSTSAKPVICRLCTRLKYHHHVQLNLPLESLNSLSFLGIGCNYN